METVAAKPSSSGKKKKKSTSRWATVKSDAAYAWRNTHRLVKWPLVSFVLGCILIFVVVTLSTSIERVESKYYAVEYSPITGKVGNDVKSEGLHVKPAYGSFILWPKTYATRTEKVECNTEDGVRVELVVTFQYLPREKEIVDLTKLYEDDDGYKSVLTKHARSAIRNACAAYDTQQFQTQRAQVQTSIYDQLLARLGNYVDTDVIDVQLSNIQRPEEYESEVDEKERARNDIDQAQNEREQALTRANTVLLQAYTTANRTLDTARTNAQNTLERARADADVVAARYAALADSYKAAKATLDYDDKAILNYISVRLVNEATAIDNPASASVALDAPGPTAF